MGNPFVENALGTASSPKRTRSSCVDFLEFWKQAKQIKLRMNTNETMTNHECQMAVGQPFVIRHSSFLG